MMRLRILTFVLISLAVLHPSFAQLESRELRRLYQHVRNIVFNIIGTNGNERGLIRAAKSNKLQTPVDDSIPFPCDVSIGRSPTRPTSVHQLRPGDIDVVGAMGDSLTAANGAASTTLVDVAIENRGLSWTIGGQANWRRYLTLPNILKEFNPNLIGYSLGDSLGHHLESQFNVAELGAISSDMNFMARVLVKRIRADRRVNVNKDWKLITIMIGPNDFCLEFCYLTPEKFRNITEVHRRDLTSVLDYLRDNLPRTLVNLVLSPRLEILHDLKGLPRYCDELHLFSCPCLFGIRRQASYAASVAKQREWQEVQREVVNDERYKRKPDFAVVLQPFTAEITFPEITGDNGKNISDKSYLSQDCFHFSQKSNARAANALWNNMMEPVGSKSQNWAKLFTRFLCPTKERPYIFTYGNSY